MKKKMRLVTILGSAALCLGLSGGILATANGCGEKEPPKKVTYTFDFNGAATAIIDQNYNPQITVGDNTTIVSVTLRNDGGVEIPLNGDYTFTPTHFGDYYYNIVVETDGVENTYVEKVSVLDVTAPVVTEKPTTKTVDLGLYGNFEKDLEQFIVSDNNAEMLGYVTKKAVAITYGGKTEENANGYSEYLFKKVGKYTVKVAITDVAGNVAYSQYEINAQDKVAPAINAFGVYYAWQNTDGTVTLPSVNVNEYSNYECTVSAMRNGQTLTQTDGKVTASVGDVLTLTYTATDEYANSATATTKLKVLEKGKLFDGADAEIETLFTSSNGMIEYADGAISYIADVNADTLAWRDGAYTLGNVSDYSGVSFTIKNYEKTNVTVLVAADVNGEKVYVGSIPLKSAAETNESVTYTLDITKYGLDEIDGWSLELQSGANLRFDLLGAQLTTFADPYFEVKGFVETYKIGETLSYEKLLFHGDEISEYTIEVSGNGLAATIGAGERYTFDAAGEYTITFTVDVGNQTFSTTETVNVSGTALTVSLNNPFTGGTVGEEYTLPTATLSDTAKTLTTSVTFGGTAVSVSGNKFTPTQSGVYTVTYQVDGTTIDAYTFAVEKANAIDFEKETAFDYSKTYGGGFAKNQDARYVASGLTSAKALIPAYGMSGVRFATPYALTANSNVATVNVYANTAGYVKVAMLVGSGLERYESDTVWLNAGANQFSFRIDGNAGDTIGGLFIYNNAKYDNIFFLDGIEFQSITAMTDVFKAGVQEYTLEQGVTFVIPDILAVDASFVKKMELTFSGNGMAESIQCYVGGKLDLSTLEVGTYNIIYKATDIFNATHERSVTLNVTAAALAGTITLGDYFVGDTINLPAPTLQSEVYNEDELASAQIQKYYRANGGLEWREIDTNATFVSVGDIDVKYIVSVGESKISLYASSYVHAQGVHFDYEKYASGDHMGWSLSYSSGRGNDTYVTDAWSHSGTYSAHITAHLGYNDTNGIIFGKESYDEGGNRIVDYDEPHQLGFKADTVVFWAYSEADRMPTQVDIDNHDWKWATGEFQLKKGAHKYVVKLNKEFDSYTRFLFTVKKNESFYIDDVSFVKSGTPVFPEMDGKEYYASEKVTFDLPEVLNPNTIAFSENDLKNMQRTVTIRQGKLEETYAYGDEALQLNLAKGNYELEFKIAIGTFEYTSTQKIKVRGVNCDFIDPRTVFENGVEYLVDLPEVHEDDVDLSAFYRKEGTADWTACSIEGGKAKVKLVGEGTFEIKFRAEKGVSRDEEIYKVLVRTTNTLFDFELDDENDTTHYDIGVMQRQGYISDAWSHDGKYSWYVDTEGHDFGSFNYFTQYVNGVPNGIRELGETYDTVTMWIKTTRNLTNFKLEIFDKTNGWIASEPINIPANTEAMYTFKMNATFTDIYQFGFGVHYVERDCFYIDSIHAYKSEVNEPQISSSAYLGDTIEFDEVAINGLPETVETNVVAKYKKAGEENYTTLTAENGKYVITPTTLGTLEIVLEVTIGYTTETFTYTVDVIDESSDPAVDDKEWQTP